MNKNFIKTLFICSLLLTIFFLGGCGHGPEDTAPFLNFDSHLHSNVSDGNFHMAPGFKADDPKDVF